MTLIMGKSVATAEQMSKYLLSKNPNPKFSRNISVLEFCQLFLDIPAKEGVRGDLLFTQSCKETGNFKYGGDVKYAQNNFAGIGATGGVPGCSFVTIEIGILAQAQHAKTYATTAPLNEPCVDPRRTAWFVKAKGGIAPDVESWGGSWAVPGYDTKRYKSLAEANAAKDSYGYQIVKILDDILKIKTTSNTNVTTNTTTTNKGGTSMGTPIIALSAGHGLYTAGKRCLKALDPSETREWYLNDRIVDKVETKLTAYHCEVIRVNDTYGKSDTALATRVNTANKANADVYISVHHNAGLNGRSGGGTQVYYYSSNAARANEAKALYDAVVKETKYNGNRSQKVVKQNLYECRKTNMPAFLIEAAFMDSSTDVPLLLTEEFAENVAVGIVNFLVDYLNLQPNGKVVNTVQPESKPVANTPVSNSSYSKTQFIKEVQAVIGARVDGIAGAETLSKTVTISKTKNRKHAVVKPVQKYLNYLGYDCGTPDGIAGQKFHTATVAWQRANGCVKDGEFTAKGKSWKKLLGLA